MRTVVRRAPDLARADDARVGAVVRWLRQVYPGGGERVEALRPDLLAERHAAHELAANSLLRQACLTDLTDRQGVQTLTVLARACTHHDQAPRLIEQALRQDLTGLAGAAIVVAVQTGALLGDLFAHVLEDASVDVADLQQIANMIPYPTVALATADEVATRRVRSLLPADTDPAQIAVWSNKLATVLAQLGRREEALAAIEEATDLYRALADARPDAFLPDLAMALNNQSNHLSEPGAAGRGTGRHRRSHRPLPALAEARPDAFLPDLAMSLNNQSNHLAGSGAAGRGAHRDRRSRHLYRALAEARPDAYLSNLATSLNNQSNRLADWGGGKRRWPRLKKPSRSAAPWPKPAPTPTCPTSPWR